MSEWECLECGEILDDDEVAGLPDEGYFHVGTCQGECATYVERREKTPR